METVEPGTVVGNMVATLQSPMVELDGEGKEREVLAVINDANVGEPFTLYQSANAWWAKEGGVQKVEKLMYCLKNSMNVEEACFSIGISRGSYYHFVKIHPEFLVIKEQLSQALTAIAKLTLGEGLKKDANLAFRFLQGTQPSDFSRRVLPELPDGRTGGAYARKTEELFMDENGEVVVTRKTAMLLENYGTDNNTSSSGE